MPAFAQSAQYRCQGDHGCIYISRTPCPGTSLSMSYCGPAPDDSAIRSRSSGSVTLNPPEDHVKHLGSECASLSEGLRTGPARGTPSSVLSTPKGLALPVPAPRGGARKLWPRSSAARKARRCWAHSPPSVGVPTR
jgi:hypothetical protein